MVSIKSYSNGYYDLRIGYCTISIIIFVQIYDHGKNKTFAFSKISIYNSKFNIVLL